MQSRPPFIDVPTALEELRAGRMVVIVDDEDRENEGDLMIAAEKVTPEAINFMAKHGRGLICAALTEERLDHLRIGMMTQNNTSPYGTAFCESVEASTGVTTGISAYDRARTIQVLIDPTSTPKDLVRPGHTFPLRSRKGGVLVRAGQTEASVDLARMAGMVPAGVICEIMKDDGSMARVPDLVEFCGTHSLRMLTVAEIIRYRMQTESFVQRVAEAFVPTQYGEFRLIAYESSIDQERHVALVRGKVEKQEEPVLVRVHRHCLVGDVFGATWCNCREVMDRSMELIAKEGNGALIYLYQNSAGFSTEKLETGGIALKFHKEKAAVAHTALTPERERKIQRDVGIGAQILHDLNLRKVRLLTDHPRKVVAVEGFDIEIVEQVPLNLSHSRK